MSTPVVDKKADLPAQASVIIENWKTLPNDYHSLLGTKETQQAIWAGREPCCCFANGISARSA